MQHQLQKHVLVHFKASSCSTKRNALPQVSLKFHTVAEPHCSSWRACRAQVRPADQHPRLSLVFNIHAWDALNADPLTRLVRVLSFGISRAQACAQQITSQILLQIHRIIDA